jgi:hypothetical protein
MTVLLVYTAATLVMHGIIWIVRVMHDPLFGYVCRGRICYN